jgi:sugar/nucleoside kinase (ribokinase family)
MLRELKRWGIEVRIRAERKMGSGVSVSIVRRDGERAFISYAGNLSKWSLRDIERDLKFISRAHALYYGGYFFMRNMMAEKAEELMRRLKDVGIVTAFDTGWDPEGWAPRTIAGIRRTLKYVNVFLPNAEEARNIAAYSSPERAALNILGYGPELVAIKLGPEGCVVAQGEEVARIPGFKCRAFDTTGAGDAFNAGFMLGYLRGWDLWKTAEFANAIGALTVSSRRQGPNRFPAREEVTAFLKGHSRLR